MVLVALHAADTLRRLLEQSEANREKNKKAVQDKYCYRQAELGVGDCGGLRYIPGVWTATCSGPCAHCCSFLRVDLSLLKLSVRPIRKQVHKGNCAQRGDVRERGNVRSAKVPNVTLNLCHSLRAVESLIQAADALFKVLFMQVNQY